MKILLLNTAHLSFDDRVFYHQAISLRSNGYEVQITSTCEILNDDSDGIIVRSYDHSRLNHKEKAKQLSLLISEANADVIIADSPRAVLAAAGCYTTKKATIIYDITEWYPSKKYLRDVKGWKKWVKASMQICYNLYAASRTDYFLFGERDKSVPFRLLFPWKPFAFLPYYPETAYLKKYVFHPITKEFKISYSGLMTEEKGLFAVIKVVRKAAELRPGTDFCLQLTGKFTNEQDRAFYQKAVSDIPANMHIIFRDFQPFTAYCNTIGDTHLFLDLRKADFENNRCLPIKLFYYFACGRPMIYSDLKAIRKFIPKVDFGYLVSPDNTAQIAGLILNYIDNPELYKTHCENAARLSGKYNWKCIEPDLIHLIKKAEPCIGDTTC